MLGLALLQGSFCLWPASGFVLCSPFPLLSTREYATNTLHITTDLELDGADDASPLIFNKLYLITYQTICLHCSPVLLIFPCNLAFTANRQGFFLGQVRLESIVHELGLTLAFAWLAFPFLCAIGFLLNFPPLLKGMGKYTMTDQEVRVWRHILVWWRHGGHFYTASVYVYKSQLYLEHKKGFYQDGALPFSKYQSPN